MATLNDCFQSIAWRQMKEGEDEMWRRHMAAIGAFVGGDANPLAYLDQRIETESGASIDALIIVGGCTFRVITEESKVWVGQVPTTALAVTLKTDSVMDLFRKAFRFGHGEATLTVHLPEGLRDDDDETRVWSVNLLPDPDAHEPIEKAMRFMSATRPAA